VGSQHLSRWVGGATVGTLQIGYPHIQASSQARRRACIRAMSCATRLRTLPPCSGGLRCCYVSHGSRPRLPARESSGATTCLIAPDPASLWRAEGDPMLPHVTRLRTLPPYLGGLRCYHVPHGSETYLPAREGGVRCCHISHDPQRAVCLKNKERLSCNGMQQGSHVSKTHPRVTEVPARHAGRRHYHDLQTMWAGTIVPRYTVVLHG
jgi:hypothetical protein